MPGLIYHTHPTLADAAFDLVFAFQNGFTGNGMHRRHPIIWTGCDVVGETIFTELAFLHSGFVFDTEHKRPGPGGY